MSKTIDEKVVKLEFNNSGFKEKVEGTIASLKNLKESLDFKGAKTGLENLDQQVQKVNFEPMSQGLDTVKTKFSVLDTVAWTVISRITESALDATQSLIRMVNAPMEQIKSGGWNRAMNIEQAKFQLTGLKIAWDNVYDDINNAVSGTAYGLDSAAKACAQLSASGVKSSKEMGVMGEALRGISGVAAMTGASYDDIANIFTRVAGQGRVMAVDLNSISARGINAAAELAKALNTTEAEIRSMVSKGQIDFETFAKAMNEAFGEHATKANETYSGSLANVKAALSKIGEGPATAKIQGMTKVFNETRLAINQFKNAIEPLLSVIQNGITFACDTATEAIKTFRESIFGTDEKSGGKIRDIFEKALGTDPWDKLSSKVSSCGINVDTFKEKLIEVGKQQGVFDKDFVDKDGAFSKSLKTGWVNAKTFAQAIGLIKEDTKAAKQEMTDFHQIVNDVIRGDFGNGADRVKALTKAGWDYQQVQDLVNAKIWGLEANYNQLNKAQTSNVKLTKEQKAALKELQSQAENSDKSIEELLAMLQKPSGGELVIDTMRNAVTSLKQVFTALKDSFSSVFNFKYTNGLYDVIYKINQFSQSLVLSDENLNKVTRSLAGFFSSIKLVSMVLNAGLHVGLEVLKALLEVNSLSILDLTAGVGDFITALVKTIDESGIFQAVAKALVSVIRTLAKLLSGPSASGAKLLSSIFTKLGNAIMFVTTQICAFSNWLENTVVTSSAFKMVAEGVTQAFQFIGNAISGAVNWITEFVSNIHFVQIWEKVAAKTGEGFKGLGDILSSLWTIAKGAFKDISEWAVGMFDKLKDGFAWLKEQQWVQGFVEKLKKTFEKLKESISDFAEKIVESGGSIKAAISNIDMSGMFNGVLSGIDGFKNQAANKVKELVRWITGGLFMEVSAAEVEESSMVGLVNKVMNPKGVLNEVKKDSQEVFTGGAKGVLSAFSLGEKTLKTGLQDACRGVLDFVEGSAIGLGAVVGGVVFTKLGDSLTKFFTSTSGFLDKFSGSIDGIGKSIQSWIKSKEVMDGTKKFRVVAEGILMLAGALWVVASIDSSKITSSIGVITLLAGEMAGLCLALSKWGKLDNANGAKTMAAIGASLLMIAFAVQTVSDINPGSLKRARKTIEDLMAFMTVCIICLSKFGGSGLGNIGGAAKTMIAAGVAIYITVKALETLSNLDTAGIEANLPILAGVFGGLIAVCLVLSKGSSSIKGAGMSLVLMAAAMKMMIGMVDDICGLDMHKILSNLDKFGTLLLALSSLLLISNLGSGTNSLKNAGAIIAMAASVFILVEAVKMLGHMDEESLKRGMDCVSWLSALISAMLGIGQLSAKFGTLPDWKSLLALAGSVAILGLAVAVLGQLDVDVLAKGITAVTVLGGIMLALMFCTKFMPEKLNKNLVVMALIIAEFAAIIYLLQDVDPLSAIGNVTAIGILMGVLAGVCKLLENTGSKFSFKMVGQLAALTLVMGAIGAIVYTLKDVDPLSAIGNATAIGLLLVAITGSLRILSGFTGLGTQAMVSLAALTGIVAILAVVLGLMSGLHVTASMETALSLSTLLLALSVSLKILSTIKSPTGEAVLALAGLVIVFGLLVTVLGVLRNMKLEMSLEQVINLSILLGALSGCLVILQFAGMAGPAVWNGLAALGTMIVGLTAILAALGWMAKKLPMFEDFLNEGIPVLQKIGQGIGEFLGGIVGGFVGGMMESFGDAMVRLGDSLSQFAEKVKPFQDAMKDFDSGSLDGLSRLMEIGAQLSATNWSDTLNLFGGNKWEKFGEGITGIIEPFKTFCTEMKDVKLDNIDEIQKVADAMHTMSQVKTELAGIRGNVGTSDGPGSMETFANEIAAMGPAIKTCSENFAGVDSESMDRVVPAIKSLVECKKALPKTGGKWQELAGEAGSMKTFAEELPDLGPAMKELGDAFSQVDTDAIERVVPAVNALVDVKKAIPPKDGVWQEIIGQPADMGEFAKELVNFIEGFIEANNAAQGITDVDKIKMVTKAAENLADLQDSIQGIGGVVQFFCGQKSLSNFGEQLAEFGKGLSDFSGSITDVDPEKISKVAAAAKSLAELADAFENGSILNVFSRNGKSLEDFGGQAKMFGQGMAGFSQEISSFDSSLTDSAIQSAKSIAEFITSLVDFDSSGIKNFNDALKDLGNSSLDKFTEVFNDSNGTAQKAGTDFMNSFATGVESVDITSRVTGAISKCVEAIAVNGGNLAEKGLEMITQIVDGISSNGAKVKSAMTAVIDEAVAAIDKNKFLDAGTSCVQSFADAIQNGGAVAKSAVMSMAMTAASGATVATSSFVSAGMMCASGFASGITLSSFVAVMAATSMAKRAAEAAKSALDINSPSKVFAKIGDSVPEGFANGIDRSGYFVTDSIQNMSDSAITSVSKTVSNLFGVFEDMEEVQPVITPILDLTDVTAGLDTVFGPNQVLSLSGINAEIQNGFVNSFGDDSPIDKLGNKLDKFIEVLQTTTAPVVVESHSHLYVDSRELAHSVAPNMQKEMSALDIFSMKLKGKV